MTDSISTPASLLEAWLLRQLPPTAADWLREGLAAVANDKNDRTFFKYFGLAPRKLGKDDLQLGREDLQAADAARAGWSPRLWSVDQAARVLLVLRCESDAAKLFERIEQLFVTADMSEQVALYRGLPLYPEQARYAHRGTEGIRTNMRPVFEAVAHHSPFPKEQFDELAWNQMVLKALFIGSTLTPIQGLDERANRELCIMLVNYAHERWAAGREVSPELWRCVGPFADDAAVDDLAKVLASKNGDEVAAAKAALTASPSAKAKAILANFAKSP